MRRVLDSESKAPRDVRRSSRVSPPFFDFQMHFVTLSHRIDGAVQLSKCILHAAETEKNRSNFNRPFKHWTYWAVLHAGKPRIRCHVDVRVQSLPRQIRRKAHSGRGRKANAMLL